MAKMSFEDCVKMVLEKEGGAAGLKAIKEFLTEKGHSTANLVARLKKVPSVGRHKHGDYVLMGVGMMKKAAKKGEGSRGGHIIGHTRSGKPIYATRSPREFYSRHRGFTKQDHRDAAHNHRKRSRFFDRAEFHESDEKFTDAEHAPLYHDDHADFHDMTADGGEYESHMRRRRSVENRAYEGAMRHIERSHPNPSKSLQAKKKPAAKKSVQKSNPIPGLTALMKAAKKGEGSRGGHIIGHTRSGKPIYASKSKAHMRKLHEGHSEQDHKDAAVFHRKQKVKYGDKLKQLSHTKFPKGHEERERLSRLEEYHRGSQDAHKRIAAGSTRFSTASEKNMMAGHSHAVAEHGGTKT
jgi:hypothetical protein